MAQHLTTARPYASALFVDAKTDAQALEVWHELLQVLAAIVEQPAFIQKAFDPKVTDQALLTLLQQMLIDIARNAADKVGAKLENFLRLVIEYKRLQAVPDMLLIYRQLMAEQQKIMGVEVCSAFELNEPLRAELQTALTKRFASDLAVRYSVDKSLIGGAVIRTDKFVMDASIKGKLVRLYHSLNS